MIILKYVVSKETKFGSTKVTLSKNNLSTKSRLSVNGLQDPPSFTTSSCCDTSIIPWKVCGKIQVDNAYVAKTCDLDLARSGIPCSTREYFMNQALQLTLNVGGICPFNTFGAILGIHRGPNVQDFEVLCTAINRVGSLGVTAHGEIEALRNCTQVVIQRYGTSYVKNYTFWQQVSIYTTGEPCTMCMSAIRNQRLGELIYATSIRSLVDSKWTQISLESGDVQRASNQCNWGNDGTAMQTRIISGVLSLITDPYFAWQFDSSAPCPTGCSRTTTNACAPTPSK